jgi:hypothetical protein
MPINSGSFLQVVCHGNISFSISLKVVRLTCTKSADLSDLCESCGSAGRQVFFAHTLIYARNPSRTSYALAGTPALGFVLPFYSYPHACRTAPREPQALLHPTCFGFFWSFSFGPDRSGKRKADKDYMPQQRDTKNWLCKTISFERAHCRKLVVFTRELPTNLAPTSRGRPHKPCAEAMPKDDVFVCAPFA